MLRHLLSMAFLFPALSSVRADVWMVKPSGALACRSAAMLNELAEIETAGARRTAETSGCIVLSPGERLVDQPEVGVGFSGHLRVQRRDGMILYVSPFSIAADPGIGSIEEDRPE